MNLHKVVTYRSDSCEFSKPCAITKPESYELNTGRPKGSSKFSKEEIGLVINLSESGLSTRKIESVTGIKYRTVCDLINRFKKEEKKNA